MLKEEFRTHTNYSGKNRFMTFPIFVFVLSFASGLTIDKMLQTITLGEFIRFAHYSAFLYGLSVGAFGLMGRELVQRRYGTTNYLVAMPYLLPISFRTTFLGIYLRDAVFYVLLMLAPATLGLMAAAPFKGLSLVSISLLFLALLLTFLIGMSLSFFASVVYIRNQKAFGVLCAAIAGVFVAYGVFNVPSLEQLIPSYGMQLNVRPLGSDMINAVTYSLVSIGIAVVLAALAYFSVEVNAIGTSSRRHENLLPGYYERVRIVGGTRRSLLAKELVDLKRSGTVAKMFFSFVLPLLFLSFTVWFVNYGLTIPVGFNAVFYAAMVGFIGVMMYSWLNNVDLAEYYSLLPVTVPQLVRIRIGVFLLLTMGISAFFVIAISVLNGETQLLWLALIVMFITSLYTVVMTAYLTGLKTNTFLFDTSVLTKFTVLSFFPDLCLTILSFSITTNWLITVCGIALVLVSLSLATWFFYKGIETKWLGAAFSE